MPTITRPDGAVIYYETYGSGYPLLLLAPGGVNSEIGMWERSLINPIREFADEFMLIAMDQRHAGESWQAPPTFSYDDTAADQLAVLDAVGVERAHVWGGCIGVAYVLRLIHDAPQRISAGIGQDPVGRDATNSVGTFTAMFQPTITNAQQDGVANVIRAAEANPLFVQNNAAGPFARRIVSDPAFRAELEAMTAGEYIRTVEDFAGGMWPPHPPLFTVNKEWLATCAVPLLILPGSDPFHPTGVSHYICMEAPQARCLDVECRAPEKVQDTIKSIRAFMGAYAA